MKADGRGGGGAGEGVSAGGASMSVAKGVVYRERRRVWFAREAGPAARRFWGVWWLCLPCLISRVFARRRGIYWHCYYISYAVVGIPRTGRGDY